MGVWVDESRDSMRLVFNELVAARSASLDGELLEIVERPHWELLEEMLEDYSFARMLDASDLVARLEGPTVEGGTPAHLLSVTMSNIWKQVRQATLSTVALSEGRAHEAKWPDDLKMDVTGTGKGSLFLGFRALRDSPGTVFRDPGHRAMCDVMRGIAEAPQFFTDTGVSDEISERFPDLAIRDSILSAVYQLAPTGRRGIAAITFFRERREAPAGDSSAHLGHEEDPQAAARQAAHTRFPGLV